MASDRKVLTLPWDEYDELESVTLGDVQRALGFAGGSDTETSESLIEAMLVGLRTREPSAPTEGLTPVDADGGLTTEQLLDEAVQMSHLPWRKLAR